MLKVKAMSQSDKHSQLFSIKEIALEIGIGVIGILIEQ